MDKLSEFKFYLLIQLIIMKANLKVIAISGVPGTGKTAVAEALVRRSGANLISIKKLVQSGRIAKIFDKFRKTWVVDSKDVRKAVQKQILPGTNIVEGIFSYEIVADCIFVLRCRPDVLRKRLNARRWSKKKIDENVEAEIVDSVLIDAIESTKKYARTSKLKIKLYEIDTTKRTPVAVAEIISKIIASTKASAEYGRKFNPGKIRWLKVGNFRKLTA